MKRDSFVAGNYGGGLDTSSGPQDLDPTQLTTVENWLYSSKGGVSTRSGFTKESNFGTSAMIDNLWTHEPYDVLFGKSDTKIKHSLDRVTWYDIGLTRTATEVEAFASIEKDVHVSNTVDSYTRIAVSTVAAINSGAGTFSLRTGDGSKFASATVYIRGIAVTSGTLSTDSYTGCSGLTSDMAVGDIVTQTTTPSGAPKASCLGLLEGSTLAGGVAANRATLYYSAHASTDAPQFSYDYVANGANARGMPTDIVAIGNVNGGNIIVLKKGVHFASTFEVQSEALMVTEIHSTFGGVNNRCIAQGQRMTYLLDAKNKRVLPVVNDADGARIIDDPLNNKRSLDYPIQGFMATIDDDQSNSYVFFDPVRGEVKGVVYKNGFSHEVVLQESIGRWSIHIGKNFRCRANFLGKVVAGSDNSDEIYLDNNGATDNGIEILHRLVSPIYTRDDRRQTMEFLNYVCGGLLSSLGQFTLRMYANDVKEFDQLITADQLVMKGLMSRKSGTPIGSGTTGNTTIGHGGDAPTGYLFTCPLDILFSGETFQFELEIMDEGTQMELRDSRLDYETEGESILSHF